MLNLLIDSDPLIPTALRALQDCEFVISYRGFPRQMRLFFPPILFAPTGALILA